MAVDNVLKLYSETIKSNYLHYGFWDNPHLINLSEITLHDIKNAQTRYIENLSSYIPKNVKIILDVGCGIGGNAAFLLKKGYDVETLSPDDYQKLVIKKKFDNKVVFYHSKFENFKTKKLYDLILESESVCYINIDKGFKRAREILKPKGYLLASDYFVYFRDQTKNPHLKSSHDLNKYLLKAKENGFELIKEYDQTNNTMPTLDYANYFIERFINPIIDYGIYSSRKNFPKISFVVEKIIASKLKKKKNQLKLIDSKEFKKYRKYMIFLFQKKDV